MPELFRVKVDYFPKLSKGEQQLARVLDNVRDLRPLMIKYIAPITIDMLRRHWDSKGAAFGQKWAPWKPSTRAARQRKGNAFKGLLRDTDHLFEAIFRDRPTDSRLRNIAGGLRFQLNTQVPYAYWLHHGTKNMVARHIFPDPMPPAFTQQIRRIVRDYILNRPIAGARKSA